MQGKEYEGSLVRVEFGNFCVPNIDKERGEIERVAGEFAKVSENGFVERFARY